MSSLFCVLLGIIGGLYLLGLVFVVLMRNSVVDCGYFGFMLFCG